MLARIRAPTPILSPILTLAPVGASLVSVATHFPVLLQGDMPAKNGRSGALLRNDEFVDKVYRILEMICEARGAPAVRWCGHSGFAGVSIGDLEQRIASGYNAKQVGGRGRSKSLSVWFCRNQTRWYGGQSYIGTTLISLTVYSSCVSEAGWKEQREWVNVFSTGEQFDLLHHLR